ncbi:DUF2788 domain-containing protein [Methylobacterium organophilum]|nr:DUF2788 domain-containing protein [Methylobacterium organophilum]
MALAQRAKLGVRPATGAFVEVTQEIPVEPEVFEKWMMIVLVGGLMAFMAFIIWDLAKKSKAGRLGTAILFLGLGLCLFAFLAKPVIGYVIEVTQGIPH